jgi:hypothetical protein
VHPGGRPGRQVLHQWRRLYSRHQDLGKKPVPFLANLGWKATNATIFGIGGQSTRFGGRFFGGLGIPLAHRPRNRGRALGRLYAGAGHQQRSRGAPPNGIPLVAGKADLPTTMDYAVRVTQRDKPHFAFDIGIGQVAGNIGSIPSPTYLPSPPYPSVVYIPVAKPSELSGCIVGAGGRECQGQISVRNKCFISYSYRQLYDRDAVEYSSTYVRL